VTCQRLKLEGIESSTPVNDYLPLVIAFDKESITPIGDLSYHNVGKRKSPSPPYFCGKGPPCIYFEMLNAGYAQP
jgi:hypothetical protein